MLPEVNTYLTTNFQLHVYAFVLAFPIFLAMLAYVIRSVLLMTIWNNPERKQPYTDHFFWIAVILVGVMIYNGFFTFIGEIREYLSHHPRATKLYDGVQFTANFDLRTIISLIIFATGSVALYFIERREKFLGAVPFYTIGIFLFATPLLYNVQFEREGLLPKEAAGCILGLQLILFFGLHFALNRRFRPIKSILLLPLALFMAWCIISFFIFPYQLSAVKNLKQLVTFAAIFFSIAFFVKSERHLKILLWFAIIAGNISVIWGLMRFFGINPFGMAESFFDEPKAGRSFLLSGFFANPNYFSEYLEIIILVSIGLAFNTKTKWVKSLLFVIAGVDTFHLLLTYTRAAWVGLGLGVIAAELMLLIYLLRRKAQPDEGKSGSVEQLASVLPGIMALRALMTVFIFYMMISKGLTSLPVIIVQLLGISILGVEIFLYRRFSRRESQPAPPKARSTGGFFSSRLGAAVIPAVAMIIVFGAFTGVTRDLASKTKSYPHVISPSDRAASLADFKGDETFRNRLNMWRVGLEMIKVHPWAGNGMGCYEIEYLEYQDRIVDRYSFEDFSKWFHNTIPTFRAHNDHLQMLAEMGVIGFGLWLWFWIAVLITSWRAFAGARSPGERLFILALFASLVSINASAMFSFPFHKIQTGGLVFVVIGTLAYIRHRQIVTPKSDGDTAAPVRKKAKKKKAASNAVTPAEQIGGYSPVRPASPIGLRILMWIFLAIFLPLIALGMYTQIQHFRSNMFFAWGSRFITANYNDYNSSRDFWFRRAYELNPSNGRAEFFWGWSTSKTTEYVLGIELLTHAQKLYPQTDTHYTLGLTYTWYGNELLSGGDQDGGQEAYANAIDAFKIASKRLPTRLEYYTELVKLLNRVGRFDEAEKYSERAIIVYNWVSMAQNVEYTFYLWRGQALISMDRLDEAVEVLKSATKLSYDKYTRDQKSKGALSMPLGDQPQAYWLLGQAYEKKGDYFKAEKVYKDYQSLRIDKIKQKENRPNDILFYQGRLYEKMADTIEDEEQRESYEKKAKDRYRRIKQLYLGFEALQQRYNTVNLSPDQVKEFTSKNGRPVTEQMYNDSLLGLKRIDEGLPFPLGEDLEVLSTESIDVEDAQIEIDQVAPGAE